MLNPKVSHRIVLCPSCEGQGFKYHEELADYHRREYNVSKIKCVDCEGSGRLWQKTKVTYDRCPNEEFD